MSVIRQLWLEQYNAFKNAVCKSSASLVPEKTSDRRMATPVMAGSASSTGSSSTPHQGDVAGIIASVAALSTDSLAQLVRDMQKHVRGGTSQLTLHDVQRPDGEGV